MSVIQICARCGTQWTVATVPGQWCPSCRGVLLSPVRTDQPVPPAHRNFRWVVRRPADPDARPPRVASSTSGPTPRYTETPGWGLLDPPPADPAERKSTRMDTLADLASTLLVWTAVVFALACVAEAFRYGLLLRNRTRLIEPIVLGVSDALVWATQLGGLVLAAGTAVASVCWLIRARRRCFDRDRTADPRTPLVLAVGCLVPVLNLVMPGVFLTEIGRDPRTLTLIRLWWGLWAVGGVLVVVDTAWREKDSLQAQADGVVLAACTALVAALTAVTTLLVIRAVDGHDLWGRPHRARRLLIATGPPDTRIAAIEPGGGPADSDAVPSDGDGVSPKKEALVK